MASLTRITEGKRDAKRRASGRKRKSGQRRRSTPTEQELFACLDEPTTQTPKAG